LVLSPPFSNYSEWLIDLCQKSNEGCAPSTTQSLQEKTAIRIEADGEDFLEFSKKVPVLRIVLYNTPHPTSVIIKLITRCAGRRITG